MRHTRHALLLTLLLAGHAGAQTPTKPAAPVQAPLTSQLLDRVVAMVGDVVITQSDVWERIVSMQQRDPKFQVPLDSAGWSKLWHRIVDGMIDEEILIAKAQDLKVEAPDADVNRAVDAQIKGVRSQFGSELEFSTELAKAGLGTPAEYRRFIADQIRRDRVTQLVVKQMKDDGKLVQVNVTEQEVQQAFDVQKLNLPTRPATVTFRQIIVNPKPTPKAKEFARVKAESLLAEIHRGGDFERIAKRESMDPSTKDVGGDLGWYRRGGGQTGTPMVPEFERWMFALTPDQISPVFETAFGFHILRVDRVKGSEVKTRHILIRPVVDSADVARAKLEADTVRLQWLAGTPFDSLAKKHHDFANKEETGVLTPWARDSLPPTYQQALAGKTSGDVVVFPIPTGVSNVPKFAVVRLEKAADGGQYTLDELRETIRDQLQQERTYRRLLDNLRKLAYVSIRLDTLPPPPAAPSKPAAVP